MKGTSPGSRLRSFATSASERNGWAVTGPTPGLMSMSRPTARSGTTMSLNRIAASTANRRSGCSVSSAITSAVVQAASMLWRSLTARYSGSDRPACRMNQTGVAVTGSRRQARRNSDSSGVPVTTAIIRVSPGGRPPGTPAGLASLATPSRGTRPRRLAPETRPAPPIRTRRVRSRILRAARATIETAGFWVSAAGPRPGDEGTGPQASGGFHGGRSPGQYGAAHHRRWRRSPSWARCSGPARTVAGNSCSSSRTRLRAAARTRPTGCAPNGPAPSAAPPCSSWCCHSHPGQRPWRKWSAGWHEERAVTAYARTMRQVGSGTAPSEEESATFSAAVAGLRSCQDQVRQIRPELCFEEVPAPRTLAPFATAVGATVRVDGAEIATGRFVLLYDPAGQRGWAGPLRVIVYIRAELEPEIAEDPMVGEVAWSWLTEALDARTAGYAEPSGTVTRVVTEGFGAKREEPPATGFELRASWSPLTDAAEPLPEQEGAPDGLAEHLAAWCGTLCAAAGLPPLAAGVSALRPAGRRRSS